MQQSLVMTFFKSSMHAALLLCAVTAAAQTNYTVQPVVVSAAAGPNSLLSVSITMAPPDTGVLVSGMDISVGYDSAKGSLETMEDNTGQPHAAVEYTSSTETQLSGVAYADVYSHVQMTTAENLISPSNLVKLNFLTSPTFSSSDTFYIYLNKWPIDGPFGGLYDHNFLVIPATYLSLEPTSSVRNWALY